MPNNNEGLVREYSSFKLYKICVCALDLLFTSRLTLLEGGVLLLLLLVELFGEGIADCVPELLVFIDLFIIRLEDEKEDAEEEEEEEEVDDDDDDEDNSDDELFANW